MIGIDPHINRIKLAKKTYGHRKNIKFIACKSVHIPILKRNGYDSFISNAVLHWIPTDEKIITFQRMFSVLKPGGYFVGNISFNRSINMQLAASILSKEEQKEIENFYYRENAEILQDMLINAGFDIVQYNYRYAEVNMGSITNFLDWITSTYYGKFNFRAAYNTSKKNLSFETFENGDVKHTSEGALFVCRKPISYKKMKTIGSSNKYI